MTGPVAPSPAPAETKLEALGLEELTVRVVVDPIVSNTGSRAQLVEHVARGVCAGVAHLQKIGAAFVGLASCTREKDGVTLVLSGVRSRAAQPLPDAPTGAPCPGECGYNASADGTACPHCEWRRTHGPESPEDLPEDLPVAVEP